MRHVTCALTIATLLLCCACAKDSTKFTKYNMTPNELEMHTTECQQYADKTVAKAGPNTRQLFLKCMKSKGYTW